MLGWFYRNGKSMNSFTGTPILAGEAMEALGGWLQHGQLKLIPLRYAL